MLATAIMSNAATAAQGNPFNPSRQAPLMSQGLSGQAMPTMSGAGIAAQGALNNNRQAQFVTQLPYGSYNNNNIGPLLQQFSQPYGGGLAPFMSQGLSGQTQAPFMSQGLSGQTQAPFMSQGLSGQTQAPLMSQGLSGQTQAPRVMRRRDGTTQAAFGIYDRPGRQR